MINYREGFFGVHTLFRVYGSATYKAIFFAAISSLVYLWLYYYGGATSDVHTEDGLKQHNLLDHPYPVAVIVTAFMFVLSAKVTFCYNRFWEACTALHNMHAKWCDVGSTLAAFHMQSKAYDKIKPPCYADQPQDVGDYPMQNNEASWETEETDEHYSHSKNLTVETGQPVPSKNIKSKVGHLLNRKNRNKGGAKGSKKTTLRTISINASDPRQLLRFPHYTTRSSRKNNPPIASTVRTTAESSSSIGINTNVHQGKDTANPSLFLQEAAHLVSLLSAVALSTLRCESEGAEAPLAEFVPGQRWPNYNSDNDADMERYGYDPKNIVASKLKYLCDVSRTRTERSAYNAARPFLVIGGVSDREALLLRSARGSSAKTALVFTWLTEFLIREQIHGSLGSVAPPIVSRIPQYMSDGHLWYNAARKMSYIPFPFAHTQMATMFTIVSVFLMPTLMLSKTSMWFGFCLNFLTVLLFAGLNELSKELEYPFRTMPNDLPLNLFQAQFNEALVTMFSGFHPDLLHAKDKVEHP